MNDCPRRLGEVLFEGGFVTSEQLCQALEQQFRHGRRLGEILLDMGAVTADQLNWALSASLGIPYVDFHEDVVDLDLARTMPEELLRRHQAFPVLKAGGELTVIVADPTNRAAVAELEALTGARIVTAIASRDTIAILLERAFPLGAAGSARYVDVEDLLAHVAGLTGFRQALHDAVAEGASEVHVEPGADRVRLRCRMNGMLVERASFDRELLGSIIARLRLLGGLGRETLPCRVEVRTSFGGRDHDLDLVLYATRLGEAAAMRLWERMPTAPTLETLRLPPAVRAALLALVEPGGGGLVVVVGPEPSAREALLYALARAAWRAEARTVTIEHRPAFEVPEFAQVEVPGDLGEAAAVILACPPAVALLGDIGTPAACAAALGAARAGSLVLAGLGQATMAAGGELLRLELPRVAMLLAVRGFAEVCRHGAGVLVDVVPMSDERRVGLLGRGGPWTSRIS